MTMKKVLLGTTALIGAGMMVAGAPAQAAEVKPGGALDLTISGFVRASVAGGDMTNYYQNGSIRDFDFASRLRLDLVARGKHETTGTEYGVFVRIESDNIGRDGSNNGTKGLAAERQYVFFRGGWGEIRAGDLNDVIDNMKVFAGTIAAGTGGIDGDDPVDLGIVVAPSNSGDATKVVYYSPTIAGFQLGVSYTPGTTSDGGFGDNIALVKNTDYQDWISGGLTWTGAFSGVDLQVGAVGGYANATVPGDTDLAGGMLGATATIFGFKFGGAVGTESGNVDRTWYNVGVGATFGPVNTSLTYGYANVSDVDDNPYDVVLSADIGLMPGVTLAGDVAYFQVVDAGVGQDTDGVTAIGRIEVAF